jgi:hypothetical protein
MSLDLQQVLPQIENLGEETVRRSEGIAARLPEVRRMLAEASALDPAELRRRIAASPEPFRAARPTSEAVDLVVALPPHPDRMRIGAADGSQIYPDRHGSAFFYLVNLGCFSLTHGSGEAPRADTRSRLYYAEAETHDSRGQPIDTHLVNARRDAEEMVRLAEWAEEGRDLPALAILDNGLLLWAASQEQNATRSDVRQILEAYLAALDRLRESGAALAGYISRPGGAHVVGLALAAAGAEPSSSAGVLDRTLFGRRLQPGERSARFRHPVRLNDTFAARGHEVQFFYLHTGAQDGIARVEIPSWVGDDPDRLAAVHTGIFEQCRVTGIPYPLVRAHELALVRTEDRRSLEDLVRASLIRHGAAALPSQKAATKRWTQRRRRHQL